MSVRRLGAVIAGLTMLVFVAGCPQEPSEPPAVDLGTGETGPEVPVMDAPSAEDDARGEISEAPLAEEPAVGMTPEPPAQAEQPKTEGEAGDIQGPALQMPNLSEPSSKPGEQ